MSRSAPLALKMMFAALALGIGATAAVGCSTESASDFGSNAPAAAPTDNGPGTGPPQVPRVTDAAAKVLAYRGNPLCHVVGPDTCMPDDDASHVTANTGQCPQAADAGDAAAAPAFQNACRITRKDGAFSTACFEKASYGGDGAPCEVGDDCGRGFDCVAGEKGTKTCRHYCCAGTCKGRLSQNLGTTFCDVQALVDVNQKAPVCMPIKHCTLLGSGECTASETCAVVTESGETGCVTVGEQQVGASCDEDHCAAKLTCLGQPGSRKCFKLCKVNSSDCDASQVCATATVLNNPTFGICQKP